MYLHQHKPTFMVHWQAASRDLPALTLAATGCQQFSHDVMHWLSAMPAVVKHVGVWRGVSGLTLCCGALPCACYLLPTLQVPEWDSMAA